MAKSNEIVLFESSDESVSLPVEFDGETVWLSKEQMGLLFGRDRTVVSRHIANIYKEGELKVEGTCAKFAQFKSKEIGRFHARKTVITSTSSSL